MKPLSKSKTRWAHVACAIWIPELDFEDARRMEPIVGMRDVRACLCLLSTLYYLLQNMIYI